MSINSYELSVLPVKDQIFDRWAIGLVACSAQEELLNKASVERTINHIKVIRGIGGHTFTEGIYAGMRYPDRELCMTR